MRRSRGELAAYALLVLAALVLRLIDLDARPFHHDESQDAYFSWVLYTAGDYEYQPILHGPFRFYLTALAFSVLGDTDFTARLAPALMGTLLVVLPYGLRDQLGRAAALFAAGVLAVGPSYLYFSRFAREDIYVACLTLAMLVVAFRFLARPRPHQPALLAALLALSFATKESTFITVFVAGSFLLAALAVQVRRFGLREAPLIRAMSAYGWEPWCWALAAFALVFTLMFTVFLTNPVGLWDGLYEGLDYWLSQQPVGRGGEPWYFYLAVLFAEEWPVLLLGLAGVVVALVRPTLLRLFLVWAFVASLIVYSWASEKFAWLVLHPLLPLLLLAGVGVQAIWERRTRPVGRLGLVAVTACVAGMAVTSWWANAELRADPRGFLVSTQSSERVVDVQARVRAVAARAASEGRTPSVVIDAAEGATFPWAWYLRELDAAYVDLSRSPLPEDFDVLVLTEGSRARLQDRLAGYDGRRFPFRVWWVRDWPGATSAGNWLRWFTRRETWNPTGGMPEWVYVRQGA